MSGLKITERQMRALNRIGNIVLPKNEPFPSFEETGCARYLGRALANAYPHDRADMLLLLNALAFMPGFVLRFLVRKMETSAESGTLFRKLNFGLKGVLYTLYYSEWVEEHYSGTAPVRIVGYKINRVELD
jgi:hypothetical protein